MPGSEDVIPMSLTDEQMETYKTLFEYRMPFGVYTAVHTAIQEAYRAWPALETVGATHNPTMYALALCEIIARGYDEEAVR